MDYTLCYLKILHHLRSNPRAHIKDVSFFLCHPLGTGSPPPIDYHPVINLCAENFITLLNAQDEDISKTICSLSYENVFEIFEDYHVQIYISITNKLEHMQSLLGFSLSELITKYSSQNSFQITPIFDRVDLEIKSDVFVIMPFQEEFNYLYHEHIKSVCNLFEIKCTRADDLYQSTPIMHNIWSLINNSSIIIADCTGKNPNVMYELGIAHTLGKYTILITRNVDDIPFDLRHLRHIVYSYTPHNIRQFEGDLYRYIDYVLPRKFHKKFKEI